MEFKGAKEFRRSLRRGFILSALSVALGAFMEAATGRTPARRADEGDGVNIVWWTPLLAAAASFVAVALLVFLLDPVARRLGLLDRPGGRKDHHAPTPVTGGLAIAIGTILPALLMTKPDMPLIGLGVGAAILIVVGVLDDIYDICWPFRIVAQVAAAFSIILIGGVQVDYIGPVFGLGSTALGHLAIPFTVLAVVGLINALNMIDGLDGLAGAMALCALVMLSAAAVYAGNQELTNGLMVMVGAVAAFLAFNMRLPWRKRARIFLGNSGSAYLGLVMAWAAFRLTQNIDHPVSPVLAPYLIAPPVIDCLVLMARRILHRKSPFAADRMHVHHLMLDGGFTVTGVVLTLSGVSLVLGLVAGTGLVFDVLQPLYVVAYLGMTATYFAWSADPASASAGLKRLTGASPTVAERASPDA
jgi:UDP-GlcNAc:undecaprenyl-phosphate GlcNAc-1-phosphate transferase